MEERSRMSAVHDVPSLRHPARHDRSHVDRLHGLALWRRPISVEPLPGGITNYNYLVRDAGRPFVARLCTERGLLGIDRRNEALCQRAAHACGIAPEVVYHAEGVLVSQFVPGRTLAPADVRDPAFLPRLAAVLRTLHDAWDQLTGEILYFSAFQAVRTYAKTALRLDARLPADIDELLEDARRLSRRIAPFVPVLCHNDLLASNILADDQRVWLVDWEYAGMGHPLFDLAGVAANCAFSESQEVALLAAYRGSADERDLRDLRRLRVMSLLREALWAVIQAVASDIDFDYHRYADDNFAAYREARARLESPSGGAAR
jgi:thiamine kinase-like enzyme